MKKQVRQKEVKFPKNKEIGKTLESGDRITIAEYAGMAPSTVREMLAGYRRITDKVAKAIIRLKKEREELLNTLDEMTLTSN